MTTFLLRGQQNILLILHTNFTKRRLRELWSYGNSLIRLNPTAWEVPEEKFADVHSEYHTIERAVTDLITISKRKTWHS